MSHHHDHNHDHHIPSSRKTLLWGLGITLAFALVEALGGWWANSLALMGDAGHMLTDAMALMVAAFAAQLVQRPATVNHSYGFKRAEVLGALFNAVFMYLIVAMIGSSALERLQDPEPVAFGSVIVIGTLGLLVNLVVFRILHRGEQTLNTRGAMLHVLGDLLGSVAAIAAGIVIALTGWMPIDPILSLLICLLILVSSTRLLLEALHVVMEAVPRDVDTDKVLAGLIAAHPAVSGIHHLHVWSLSSNSRALSAHVEIDSKADWQASLAALENTASSSFNIGHCTFQPEFYPRCDPDRREALDP